MDPSLDEEQAGPFSPMWTAQAVRQHLAGASIRGGLAGAAPRQLGLCVMVRKNCVPLNNIFTINLNRNVYSCLGATATQSHFG